jgi:endonuclease/exonuclease/phosphatase family metal-dependent hydrolase
VRLVVTTWNLQGSEGVDVDAVAAHVQARGSDLLLVQEVQRRQAHRLLRALEGQSLSWSFKHWPVRIPAEGMAVIGVTLPVRARTVALTQRLRWWTWRRRIAQLATLPPDGTGRGGHRLVLANVHLSPHADAAAIRERELAHVLQLLDRVRADPSGRADEPSDLPTVVAGDLNMGAATAGKHLAGHGMGDAWMLSHPEGSAGATMWAGVPRHGPANRRIDHVWVSSGATVVSAHVPVPGDQGWEELGRLSDHLPLTVTLDV